MADFYLTQCSKGCRRRRSEKSYHLAGRHSEARREAQRALTHSNPQATRHGCPCPTGVGRDPHDGGAARCRSGRILPPGNTRVEFQCRPRFKIGPIVARIVFRGKKCHEFDECCNLRGGELPLRFYQRCQAVKIRLEKRARSCQYLRFPPSHQPPRDVAATPCRHRAPTDLKPPC
jgi:hypothetical protein